MNTQKQQGIRGNKGMLIFILSPLGRLTTIISLVLLGFRIFTPSLPLWRILTGLALGFTLVLLFAFLTKTLTFIFIHNILAYCATIACIPVIVSLLHDLPLTAAKTGELVACVVIIAYWLLCHRLQTRVPRWRKHKEHFTLHVNVQSESDGCQWKASFALFITRHGTTLFLSCMAVCMAPVFLIASEFNAPFIIAFKYLSVPIVLVSFYVGLNCREAFLALGTPRRVFWLCLVISTLTAILFSGGLVLGANAVLPPQTEVVLEGTVTSKTTGKYDYYLHLQGTNGVTAIEVSRGEYEAARMGSTYRGTRRMGPFGFSYVWKHRAKRKPP